MPRQLWIPGKDFSTDRDVHVLNAKTIEAWAEGAKSYWSLEDLGTLPALAGYADGSLIFVNDVLYVKKAGVWAAISVGGGSMKKVTGSGYQVVPDLAVGPNVLQGNTANAYGSWVEITSGIGSAIYIVGVHMFPADTSSDASYSQFQIGTGTAGSEVVVSTFKDSWTQWMSVAGMAIGNHPVFFPHPIAIATSTRLAMRVADPTGGNLSYRPSIIYVVQTDLVDL